MKFGYFDNENREYVINTPKTPYPWINYLGNEDFLGLVSNTAGGYTFYKDARMRRLTRYRYNNVPVDNGGRYFYINDGGDIWSPGWKPVKAELDHYECRHGMGYTTITGARNKVQAEVKYFIPLKNNAEIHAVKLTNLGDTEKTVSLFSFLEFCLWDAQEDMTNFQRNFSTGEVEVVGSTIYHKTEYRERRNHYAFYTVNTEVQGFDTDRDSFIGLYNGFHEPEAVLAGNSTNSVASGWSPIASHGIKATLQPGETKEYIFVLGYIENPEEEKWESLGIINKKPALELMEKFNTSEKVEAAFEELKAYWKELLSKYVLHHADDKLLSMVNIWNPYQCMTTFNLSRSASFFESGIGRGMGFRDSNQDLLGFVHLIPERAKQRILDIAATQFRDGSAYHQYQPLTKKGNNDIGKGFNDDPLWLILAVAAYIKESGDFGILDEQVPFDCNAEDTGTLFEHLTASFQYTVNNLGPHNLPLIGRADWNDCLNLNCFSKTPGESFQTTGPDTGVIAESVFIAGMFVYIGKEYVEICRRLGLEDTALEAENHIANMEEAVKEHGYDGEWYLRAYDSEGKKIGSKENKEGQIFIESQGFCSLAGIGLEEGLVHKSLDSVKKHLDTPYGIVLQQPPYQEYDYLMGEITSYPPGYKENAGIFCHNNPWVACAETTIGRGDRAFEIYSRIAPAYVEDISDLHKTEPYVYSQMVAGKDAKHHGQAKNSWLTGTAAWNFVTIAQYILGVHPSYDGLMIDPCIPQEWDGYSITRKFRENTYVIQVDNKNHVSKGIKEIRVDGRTLVNNYIPYEKSDKVILVEVTLG